MRALIAFALLATSATPLAAQETSGVNAQGTDERKICRRIGNSSSTRISRLRVCLTPQQWRERRGGVPEEGEDTLSTTSVGNSIEVPNSNYGEAISTGRFPPR